MEAVRSHRQTVRSIHWICYFTPDSLCGGTGVQPDTGKSLCWADTGLWGNRHGGLQRYCRDSGTVWYAVKHLPLPECLNEKWKGFYPFHFCLYFYFFLTTMTPEITIKIITAAAIGKTGTEELPEEFSASPEEGWFSEAEVSSAATASGLS